MPTLCALADERAREPPHFVGRSAELARIQRLLHEASLGSGSAVVVAGDNGVGKSRFLRECASLRSSATTLLLQCETGSLGGHGLLEQLADALRPAGAANGPRATPAVHAALVEACRRKPVAVLIDDAHLADPGEVRALDALLSLVRRQRLVVIACHIATGASASAARNVNQWIDAGALVEHLRPLSDAETELLIRSLVTPSGRPLEGEQLREVVQISGGNPRLAVELVAAASASVPGAVLVAPSARATVAFARELLSKRNFEILSLCSVVGAGFCDAWIVDVAACSQAEVAEALQAASDLDILAEDPACPGWYAFRHPAVRTALYASLVSLKRKLLHERVVRHLAARDDDTHAAERNNLIAEHWHILDSHAHAAEWLMRVADDFSQCGAFAQAAQAYARAAGHLPGGSKDWFAAQQHVVRCYRNLGNWGSMIPVVRTMLATFDARDEPNCADALLWDLFFAHLNNGDRNAAAAIAADISNLNVPDQPNRSEIATLILAYGAYYAGRRSEARDLMQDIEFDRLDNPEGQLRHLIADASINALAQPLERSLALVDRAAEIASGIGIRGTAHALGDGAEIASRFGDLAKARLYLERMTQTAQRSAGAVNGVKRIVDKDRTHVSLLAGDLATARELVYASLLWRDAGRHNLSWIAGAGVFVGMRVADLALVDALFDPPLLFAAVAARDAESCGRLLPGFAEVMQARGLGRDLRNILAQCVEQRLVDAHTWIPLCAARYGTNDCADAACELMDDYLSDAIAPTAAAHKALYNATVSRRRGKHILAAEAARDAALRYRQLGWRLHEALALETAGDRADASSVYAACGAVYDAARLAGEQTRKLRRAPFGARLTGRELEVARLVARGRSNSDIGRALEISVRTVHHHVEAAFNKLGVRARWQLSAEMLEGSATLR